MTGLSRNRIFLFATLILIALAASLALASCGSDSSGTTASTKATTTVPPAVSTTPAVTTTTPAVTTPATSVPPAPQSVNIANFSFSPADITVPKGTTVQWTNGGSAPHTITADGGLFNSGNIAPGQSFSFTFDQAGTYTYHCSIHATMTGSITVT